MNWSHRIYGKLKTEKRFKPYNLRECRPVINLIYASCFAEHEAIKAVEELNRENPEYIFEARAI